MGTIYRNGVPFVGSGGAGGVEMTQAEYDLLPTSEKMNGAIYFITDGDVSYPTASQMRYDNTESQIPSTTVQGAIDENRIEINSLKSGLTNLLVAEVKQLSNHAITRLSSSGAYYSDTEVDVSKSGYTPVSCFIYAWSSIKASAVPYITSSTMLGFTSDVSQTPSVLAVKILYLKN